MELWDLYTKYRQKTGKEHIRGEKIPDGCYHLVVHVWIRNSKGEYLISQRSATRPTFPLMWECVGGSVLKGESSIEGAVREIKEEVGLDVEPERGKLEGKVIAVWHRFDDVEDKWIVSLDGKDIAEEQILGDISFQEQFFYGKLYGLSQAVE